MPPRKILFATDLSCRCDRPLDRAALLAAGWKARLVVAHVVEELAAPPPHLHWREHPDPHRAALERVGEDLQDIRGVEYEVVVRRGEPAAAILELAEASGCDLVVTGTARDEPLGRSLVGTTVEKLARHASAPVLVVKTRPRGPYRNVAVATDFSEGSRAALETVLGLLPEAEVGLAHAFDVTYESLLDDKAAMRRLAESRAKAEGERFLADTAALAGSAKSIGIHCEYGVPEAALPQLVKDRRFDLVALGREGRSRLAEFLFGSVANQLLASMPIDVLLARRRRT